MIKCVELFRSYNIKYNTVKSLKLTYFLLRYMILKL